MYTINILNSFVPPYCDSEPGENDSYRVNFIVLIVAPRNSITKVQSENHGIYGQIKHHVIYSTICQI